MPAAGRLHLPHGSIARNLAVVGGGTALGQGSLVLAAPVLARLYDPQAFGLLSIYTAVISVLLAVASFRFDLAIPTADDAGEAVHLLGLSVVLAIVTSAVVGLVVLVWGDDLAGALGAAEFGRFVWLLPVGLLIASLAQALSSWAVYQRAFSALGRMRAIQGVAQGVVQATLGLLRIGPVGLLLGDAAGRAFGTEQLFRVLLGTLRSTRLSARTMLRHGRARWSFARVMTAASLLNMLSLQVPFLLIPALFDLASSGQYFLAYRILILPAALVAAAVNQVFFGEASARRADPGRLHDLTHQVAVSLLVISIPTYAIVAVAGQSMIVTVFGQQWATAGLYAQLMAPSLILWTVASPISALLLVGRRERESLVFTAVELGSRAGSLLIGALVHSLTIGIAVLAVVSVLVELAALWRFLRVASVGLGELVLPAARILIGTVPVVLVVLLAVSAAPVAVLPIAVVGWVLATGLALRLCPEPRALLAGRP